MGSVKKEAPTDMALGAAKILFENREKLTGTVKFVFQPYEEGGFDNGLPVDLLIMGGRNDDANVLKAGCAYEKNYPCTFRTFQ